ncbi:SERINE/THREONINE-PROTEIN PHOSPHATASE 2A 55 KDA REGULATORY SUBUNIT B [Salix koriyanagi]|uniref:Serine/threonine-protein phosphatase 2A 55 kDa regulatory subunit B n=1 Tax=Salix koriyanagi TaxID=2511006 RepID=A0A9Q0PXJ7_9ROSI|nr:SERINE/THREONINE-PROTEIN PHOSPHATASE 2A 55 KDA REGULATORY SUBUNIT B [Salix koriyanagi]
MYFYIKGINIISLGGFWYRSMKDGAAELCHHCYETDYLIVIAPANPFFIGAQLILFQLLNLIEVVIILQLVTVEAVWFSLRELTLRIMVDPEGIWRGWVTQLIGILSFDIKQNFRVMNLSLTISRYWKVQEKKVKKISEMNVDPSKPIGNGGIASSSNSSIGKQYLANGGDKYDLPRNDFSIPPGGFPSLRLPVVTCDETSLMARCRRVYAHAHDYHINSISNNSDGETFISADDLRINLWNLEISNQSFNIVDVKPANMEDLTEVITSAEFHPGHCNMLAYSSSKGSIRLIDLRQSALCDSHAKLFEEPDAPGSRSFFTEIIASISDIKFARDGRHILSRDYMTLKLWDINMDSGPVATFQVHDHLRPKLCDLYENDSIFDKFECCLSGDGLRVATGSYRSVVFFVLTSGHCTIVIETTSPCAFVCYLFFVSPAICSGYLVVT